MKKKQLPGGLLIKPLLLIISLQHYKSEKESQGQHLRQRLRVPIPKERQSELDQVSPGTCPRPLFVRRSRLGDEPLSVRRPRQPEFPTQTWDRVSCNHFSKK